MAGTTVLFSALACPNVPFTLYLQGVSPALGLTYQWESLTISFLIFLLQEQLTHTGFKLKNISTYYRVMIKLCSNGGGFASSIPLQMNMNTYANCIWQPQLQRQKWYGRMYRGQQLNNYIGNVTFVVFNNTNRLWSEHTSRSYVFS